MKKNVIHSITFGIVVGSQVVGVPEKDMNRKLIMTSVCNVILIPKH